MHTVVRKIKPDCVLDYNRLKIGVDLNDQYVSYCLYKGKTMKWGKKMLLHLVARWCVYASIVSNKTRVQNRDSRSFL